MFQVGLSASRYLVENKDKGFTAERDLGPIQNGCPFVSYLAYITGAKFEQHHSNLS